MKIFLVYNENNVLREIFTEEEKAEKFIEAECDNIKNIRIHLNDGRQHVFSQKWSSQIMLGSFVMKRMFLDEAVFDSDGNIIETNIHIFWYREWEVK